MAIALKSPARPFTYEDLDEMPDDGYRREIIGGSLVVTPSPTGGHQYVLGNLNSVLRASAPPDLLVIFAPFDWKTPDGGTVVPDIVVIRREDLDRNGPLPPAAIPLLVVEVLSPSNQAYDRAYKRQLYESLGVPAYWIVDPDAPSVLALRLVDGEYTVEAEAASGELVTDWPFPVRFEIAGLAE